jgi:CRP-like cAMP-binding protein
MLYKGVLAMSSEHAAVADKIDRFFSNYPRHAYPKGQILVFAGEDPGHIFYLAKGRVRKYDVSYRGDEVVVNLFKPPAFFPMSWALNGTHNEYFYKTELDTVLHTAPAEDALAFVRANPDVLLDLLSRVYRGMDGLLGKMVHLMSGTAKSRLVYELIIESRRFGKKQPDGTYVLSTSEVDFAARSGLSRETVSREIGKLKQEGLVARTKDGVIIKNLQALEQSLGGTL